MATDLALAPWVAAEGERIVADLLEWLRIPSISAQPGHAEDVRRSADLTADLLARAGMEHVEIVDTAGAPAVYADHLHAGPGVPTALVYGHHDVQPVDPLDEWRSPPFEPYIADGNCHGRGAVDDKGQVLFQIEAARGLLTLAGALPVNLRFLVEGEEEVGSPNFEALLERERARLGCDVVVVSDTDMWAPAFHVDVRTATADLHSGLFGGAVPNSAHLVAALVAALHDDDGRVTIPGFYDDVRPLTATPLFTRIGGSAPEEALGRILHAPVLYLGVAYPDDRFHAPNERMVMDQFWKGLLAAGELWRELADLDRGRP